MRSRNGFRVHSLGVVSQVELARGGKCYGLFHKVVIRKRKQKLI